MSTSYDYTRLSPGSIRLFTLLPPTRDKDPITGRLEITSLPKLFPNFRNSKPYEALSHHWGDEERTQHIICDGKDLTVTPKLSDALEHLRRADSERTLWIDAICINQADKDERAVQIPLMRDIYGRAESVSIWLGVDDTYTVPALKLIDHILGLMKREIPCIEQKRIPSGRANLPFSQPDFWKPLIKLFSRPWFTRVWVVQEIALARSSKIMVGKHEREWSDIAKAANYLHVKSFSANVKGMRLALGNVLSLQLNTRAVDKWVVNNNIFFKILHVLNLIFLAWIFGTYGKRTRPLVELLESTNKFEATNPRDRIYGLLGLANEGDMIKVDRKKEVVDVYTEATLIILCTIWKCNPMYGLRVLASVQREKLDPKDQWPSWVQKWQNWDEKDPDKKQPPVFKTSIINNLPSSAKFCAGGNKYPTPIPFDLYSIQVKGFVFDKITSNVHYMEPMPLSRPHLWELVEVIRSVRKDWNASYPTGEVINEVMALVLTLADTVANHTALDPETYHGIDFQHFCLSMYDQSIEKFKRKNLLKECQALEGKCSTDIQDLRHDLEGHDKSPTFSKCLQGAGMYRRLFETERGYIGIGPLALRDGDAVCVLFGSNVPFVLRMFKEGERHGLIRENYGLVGECYLHGIMRGEALKEKEGKEKWFELR